MDAVGQFYRIIFKTPSQSPGVFRENREIQITVPRLCPFCGSTEVVTQVKILGRGNSKQATRKYIKVWVCSSHKKRQTYITDNPKKKNLIFEWFSDQCVIHIQKIRNDWVTLFSTNNPVLSMAPNQSPFNPSSVPATRLFWLLLLIFEISLILVVVSGNNPNAISTTFSVVFFFASSVGMVVATIYGGIKMPILRAEYYFGPNIRERK